MDPCLSKTGQVVGLYFSIFGGTLARVSALPGDTVVCWRSHLAGMPQNGLHIVGNFTDELLTLAVELPITWGDRALYMERSIYV